MSVEFVDDLLDRQATQHPGHRARFGPDGLRDLRPGAGTGGEHVRDAERRRDVQQLRRDVPLHHAGELPLRLGRGHRPILSSDR